MAVDVPDRGPVLVHSMIALIVLCDTAVLLRFVSRKIAKSGFGYDDYMAVIAMVRFTSPGSVPWRRWYTCSWQLITTSFTLQLFANGNAVCVLVGQRTPFVACGNRC